MRYTCFFLLALILTACGGSENSENQSDNAEDEIPKVDTVSYDYFKSNFIGMTLPIHFDSSYLWDGGPFWREEAGEYDFDSGKIPIHLIDKWIVEQDKMNSSFSEFVNDNRKWLNEKNGWKNIYYGGSFEENERDYFIVYVYDKPSQVNGAQFYYYFMEFENEELLEVIELGREGVQTYPYSEQTEEEFLWWRNTTYYSVEIDIRSGSDIEVCEYMRFEVEGDVSNELLTDTIKPNVYYDSTGPYLEIYPVKCVEY